MDPQQLSSPPGTLHYSFSPSWSHTFPPFSECSAACLICKNMSLSILHHSGMKLHISKGINYKAVWVCCAIITDLAHSYFSTIVFCSSPHCSLHSATFFFFCHGCFKYCCHGFHSFSYETLTLEPFSVWYFLQIMLENIFVQHLMSSFAFDWICPSIAFHSRMVCVTE